MLVAIFFGIITALLIAFGVAFGRWLRARYDLKHLEEPPVILTGFYEQPVYYPPQALYPATRKGNRLWHQRLELRTSCECSDPLSHTLPRLVRQESITFPTKEAWAREQEQKYDTERYNGLPIAPRFRDQPIQNAEDFRTVIQAHDRR